MIKLGFLVSDYIDEKTAREYGWDYTKGVPNTRRAHFEVVPFAGHELKKDTLIIDLNLDLNLIIKLILQ